ncbi:uncharacterized protein LOC102794392 [Neolamprologus brichardi]|uniref:uncharacterized protein LOC102794392 n=1 Tax=Neolamprologus brichardi TaxID=32507 RepID=UPI0003EBFA32|nr:uncharacterized protein LOC102794392 [Neolamprologus brichardi]
MKLVLPDLKVNSACTLGIHKRPERQMRKMRKLARCSCEAIRTKVKRSAPWHQKIEDKFKFPFKYKLYKLKKSIQISTFTSKKAQQLYFGNFLQKSFANGKKFEFKIKEAENSTHKNAHNNLLVSKIKNSHFLKRKWSFPDDLAVIKKPKRNPAYPNSIIPFHSKILHISGNQIIFVQTFHTHTFPETLTAAEAKHRNKTLPNLHHNKRNTCSTEEQQKMKLFKDESESIRRQNKNEEKFYHSIKEMQKTIPEKIPSVDANRCFPFLKEYLQIHGHKQYAFVIVAMKHSKNIIVSPAFQPDYEKKGNPGKTKHSEPRLCEAFEPFMQQNGNLVETILIYTFNSPCLGCMSLLLEKAYLWRCKYGFSTTVAFTQFYGLSGQNCFQTLTYSSTNMLGPCGVFYEDSQRWKRDHFKLKSFTVNSNIFQNIRKLSEKGEKESCRKKIESYVSELQTLAKNSFCSRETHLQRGKNTIYSFVFPPMIQDACRDSLLRDWSALVNDCAMSNMRQKITLNFNVAIVEVINQNLKSSCGNNSPLKLCHIPLNLQ